MSLLARRMTNIGSAAAAPVTYESEVTADSPAHYWKMDETSGSTVADSVGSADGTVTGADLATTPLIAEGGGAGFDGVDDNIWVGDISATSYNTIDLLFRPRTPLTSSSSARAMFGMGGVREYHGVFVGSFTSNLANELVTVGGEEVGGGDGALVSWATSAVTLPTSTQHLAFVWDGTVWQIYYNGVLQTSRDTNKLPIQKVGMTHLRFGARTFSGSVHLPANIDLGHFAIYPTALSASRILAHAQAAGVA